MTMKARTIIEILRRPAEYSLELVSRAMNEVLEISGGYYLPRMETVPVYARRDRTNGQ